MKRPLLLSVLLYAALSAGANPLLAAGLDPAALQTVRDMREGELRKLAIAETPKPFPQVAFENEAGEKFTMADFNGHYRLVNFWATWCPPCREEMPSLEALQQEMGGADFQVMTIATGRNRLEGIHDFFDAAGVENLPVLLDPRGKLGRAAGALGLPTSIILDPEGNEIARLTGGADWNSDNAKAVIRALMGQ